MQNFAINGGTLNGDPEVWIDDSSASLVVQAAGSMAIGLVLSGAAQTRVASDLSLSFMAKLEGYAPVLLSADGVLTNGLVIGGAAPIQLKASGDFLRWVMIEGVSPTVVDLTGDIQVVPAISATFALVLSTELDLHVATGQHLEGLLPVVLGAGLDAHVAHSRRLSGLMPVELAGIGYGRLLMTSPTGAAAIKVSGQGDARLGAKLSLEGSASIGLYARGYLDSWHYVYAGGDFDIGILARAEKHGTPNIPGYYIGAPVIRLLRVGEESRQFTVPAERRV